MNNRKQKMKGAAEEVVGKLKAGVGQAIGSAKIEAEGRAIEEKGKSRQEAAKAAERAKGTLQNIGGKIEKAAGRLVGDDEIEADGVANEIKGTARVRANKPSRKRG